MEGTRHTCLPPLLHRLLSPPMLPTETKATKPSRSFQRLTARPTSTPPSCQPSVCASVHVCGAPVRSLAVQTV